MFGMSMIDLATLAAALAALASVAAAWDALSARGPARGRLKALQARREALKAGLVTAPKRSALVKRTRRMDSLRSLLKRLQILQTAQVKQAQVKLVRAGWRNRDTVLVYLFCRLALPLAVTLVAGVAIGILGLFAGQPLYQLAAGPGAILLAFKAPDLIVENRIQKRMSAMRKALPDALDLMVICAEAGLTLDAALNRVAKEISGASTELSDELGLTAIELGFLPDRREALTNLAERVTLEEVRGVVTTLMQTEKYGTPLAMSLRVLAAEFRNERMMRAEEKAARLPAVMTVPLILFIMPTLFVVLLGPAACQVSDNFIGRSGS